ncbi:M66 family metalloprotease [Hahella sp. HN01]|uniref:M66 family metalloprotease n=1 Tax=Hahella sp. HN01 TaxID=2847262 RepID=UPI001C1EBB74|nr:M66 family metalloprotease [Hahella sp. HN01]MBU6955673.1 hypothetical protein [Hahella sp. HN01]
MKLSMIMVLLVLAGQLSGCGGNDDKKSEGTQASDDSSGDVAPDDNSSSNDDAPLEPTSLRSVEFAQSHVIPPSGLSWDLKESGELQLVEKRDTLVLATFDEAVQAAEVRVYDKNHQLLSSLNLSKPSDLPPTEGDDLPYSDDAWSAVIPSDDMSKGVNIRVVAQGKSASETVTPAMHPELDLTIQSLPFLIYGVNESNIPFKIDDLKVMFADPDTAGQGFAGMPFSKTHIVNHPLGVFESDYLIVPPSGSAPAKKVESAADPDYSRPILDMVWHIEYALGDMALNKITFAPSMLIDHSKTGPIKTRGLGGVAYTGSGASMGYPSLGLLWHEGGHAIGLPHSLSGSKDVNGPYYPYAEGSLSGSVWGYDQYKRYFRSPLTAPTSRYFACSGERGGGVFQKNAEGRCYRFDPMHSADEQKDPDADFPLFSDFNAGKMQRWVRNRARMNPSNDGFQVLDDNGDWADFVPETKHYAGWHIKEHFPVSFDETTDFIMVTYSLAGTDAASQFYNPIRYKGNAIEYVDAIDQDDLNSINADISSGARAKYSDYCRRQGCDFTLKVTYEDGSTSYRVLKGSARKDWQPSVWKDDYLNENSKDSYLFWAVALVAPEGAPKVKKLELLDTPMLWNLSPTAVMAAKALVVKQL